MRRERLRGFTWIDAMATTALVGILASIAYPSYRAYVARGKAAEAVEHLGEMARLAAAYEGRDGERPCALETSARIPATPGAEPRRGDFAMDATFRAIGFRIEEPTTHSYQLRSMGMGVRALCRLSPGPLYTLLATGDLDGDGVRSRFELRVELDEQRQAHRALDIAAVRELE